MRKYVLIIAGIMLWATPALAQFGASSVITVPGSVTSDQAAESSLADIDASTTDIDNQAQTIAGIEQQNIQSGQAGGFDWSQTLQGDLEQQVSSAGGMPLVTDAISAYSNYWPGYSNAGYLQGPPPPGSPEANMATTLGTLQGALQAGADQQQSQRTEAVRMENLENKTGNASGNLQVQEAGNEIALFNAQEEMKQRNATNGTLNALLVAESNRQNQAAQNDLQGLGIATENAQWDATNHPPGPDPQIPDSGVME